MEEIDYNQMLVVKKENRVLRQKVDFAIAVAEEINKNSSCHFSRLLSSKIINLLKQNER
jgi:hypothetical protein